MQIYTKILLGMTVGAIVGATLGPTSTFLSHDLYKIDDALSVRLFLDQDNPASAIQFPQGTPIDLTILKTNRKTLKDAKGVESELAVWAQVELEYTKTIGLRDKTGTLRKALGGVATGDTVKVWLQIQNRRLEEGGFMTTPTVSASDVKQGNAGG
ncbi:MAG TPA: hypothetical protein EYN66_03235 [Myxococcales bacterium]|nr:hypothetical protein [Myxococcales bacterium]